MSMLKLLFGSALGPIQQRMKENKNFASIKAYLSIFVIVVVDVVIVVVVIVNFFLEELLVPNLLDFFFDGRSVSISSLDQS